jgi:hypothetical protein
VCVLSIENRQSYCTSGKQCKQDLPDIQWTIYGLWPNGIVCDHGPPLKVTELQPIVNQLNSYWISYTGSNEDFSGLMNGINMVVVQ